MPGLVGFLGSPPDGDMTKFVQNMMYGLEGADYFRRDSYIEDECGLGRVSLGIINSQAQPVWNDQKTRCILLEGELFEQKRLRDLLAKHNKKPYSDDDAGLMLSLYETLGKDCAIHLNGGFIAAIWDTKSRQITLINDRLGQYPVYYARYNGKFSFASGVRALLQDPDLPREVDHVAIAEFLMMDHVLNDRTFLTSVKLMPQASILQVNDDQINIHSYYDFKYPEYYPLRSEEEYIEEYVSTLEQAVARQSIYSTSIGILLSGGLDSRFLLPYLQDHVAHKPVQAFTWGTPSSDDVQFAREVATTVGTEHHYFELQPDWLKQKGMEAVRITDGMGNLVNLHALATLDQEIKYANVILKGFLGDAMFGFAVRQYFWANYDSVTLPKVHYHAHQEIGVITFSPEEQKKLFSQPFLHTIGNTVMDEYTAGLWASGTNIPADQRIYFDFRQRVPRMTIKGVEVVRSKALVRLPFADNDLVEFALRVPPGLREERRLVKEAFIRTFPKLAQIPVTPSGLPMVSCAREIRIRAERFVRWHMINRGLIKGPYTERRPYANYHQWFRTVLKSWVEENLLSEKAVSRGYYNPETLRQLVNDHMEGANYAVRLGALMSIELWHQQFLD